MKLMPSAPRCGPSGRARNGQCCLRQRCWRETSRPDQTHQLWAATDLESKVEAVAQQIAGQL